MSTPRTFNDFWSEQLERNRRAAQILMARHLQQPFKGREEIQAAYRHELQRLEAGTFSIGDERDLRDWGISL